MTRLSVAVIALALLTGCAAQRVLEVTSEPAGATVLLDGTPIGTTPLEFRFEHYGVRRITLYHTGYHTHSERLEMSPPWYLRFPIDIVTEVLLPFGWNDRHTYSTRLIEGEDLEDAHTLRAVVERANRLRHAGDAGPRELTPTARPPQNPDRPGRLSPPDRQP